MSSSGSETTLDEETPATSKTLETEFSATSNTNPSIDRKIVEDQNSQVSDQLNESRNEEDIEEDEEEGECGFCLYMKGGGCREQFIAWEKCIEDSEKNKQDIVEKCFEVTRLLKMCMDAHSDYYEPILRAEKSAEEEAAKEMDREAASKESKQENAANR